MRTIRAAALFFLLLIPSRDAYGMEDSYSTYLEEYLAAGYMDVDIYVWDAESIIPAIIYVLANVGDHMDADIAIVVSSEPVTTGEVRDGWIAIRYAFR